MKDTMNFAQQNAEQAAQATNLMREITEHNLNQSRAAFAGLLAIARNAVHGFDHQASVICEHSMLFAEETLSNTFDFANRLVRMREPQEFAQIQSEFISRQARLLGRSNQGTRSEHHARCQGGNTEHSRQNRRDAS
jgi:hypothetical protein